MKKYEMKWFSSHRPLSSLSKGMGVFILYLADVSVTDLKTFADAH